MGVIRVNFPQGSSYKTAEHGAVRLVVLHTAEKDKDADYPKDQEAGGWVSWGRRGDTTVGVRNESDNKEQEGYMAMMRSTWWQALMSIRYILWRS